MTVGEEGTFFGKVGELVVPGGGKGRSAFGLGMELG